MRETVDARSRVARFTALGRSILRLVAARPPRGDRRIRNTQRLLTTAAATMSVLLIASSFVTTLLIPRNAFLDDGPAKGRALAFLAHDRLGSGFGTVYDVSTILILWFAGASSTRRNCYDVGTKATFQFDRERER